MVTPLPPRYSGTANGPHCMKTGANFVQGEAGAKFVLYSGGQN